MGVGRHQGLYGRFGRLAAAGAALAVGAGLAAPAEAKSAPVRVGPIAAIVAADYADNNAANATLSYAKQADHEEGTALALDDASFRADKLAGYATADGARYYPFTGRAVATSVPAQSAYPVRFAAYLAQSSPPGTPGADAVCAGSGDAAVFQKDGPSSPWRITFEPYAPRIAALPALAQSHGHGLFATGGHLATPLADLAAQAVAALAHRSATGGGDALAPASLFTSGACGHLDLWDPHQFAGVRNGLTFTSHTSAVSPSDLVAFATADGGALAFVTLREQYTERPQAAGDYVQWSHGSYVGWDLLAAGRYSEVTFVVDQQLAIYDPPASSGQAAHVVAGYNGVVSVTAARAA